MSGDHNMYQKTKSYLDDFECPRCGHCCHIEGEHTNTLRQAAQKAVQVMDAHMMRADTEEFYEAKEALRQALEEKQEPLYWNVADGWVYADDTSQKRVDEMVKTEHEWVGLTDEEVSDAIDNVLEGGGWLDVARALEAAIKRKNT